MQEAGQSCTRSIKPFACSWGPAVFSTPPEFQRKVSVRKREASAILVSGQMMPFRPAVIFFPTLLVLLSQTSSDNRSARNVTNECGTRPVVGLSQLGSRIVGGRESVQGAWPWQVSLQVYQRGAGFLHLCGGSLINNNTVLTAAHCTAKKQAPEMWRAVIGLHHLFQHGYYTVKRRVKAIKNHYYYDSEGFEHDISLFQLSKPITYNDYIHPICLPNSTLVLTSDMICYISGWGMKKEKGKSSYTLQEAQLKIFSLQTCNQHNWYAGTVPSTAFCAGSETGDVDTCQGDSGGPLGCYLPDSKYYLIGITSYGVGCGRPRFPGIYTSLPKYRHWVEKQLSETNTVSIQHILFLTVVWTIFQLVV
ncbi:transmembrane protease serine 12-like [Candoia aspera]|uniref:transmembrane protease serine 12-like n=1 Tax=Candoia aspera TaxID=51853 RepID=UPI002FD86526